MHVFELGMPLKLHEAFRTKILLISMNMFVRLWLMKVSQKRFEKKKTQVQSDL